MLRKLSPRHLDIIRRLIVAETPGEICLELGMSESHLSVLQIDPLFKAKLNEMQDDLEGRFLETRANAMQVLEGGAVKSAQLVVDAVTFGKFGEKEVGVSNRLRSAWDVLDRTGNKAPDRKLVGHFDAAELVKEAYVKKYRGNGDTPEKDSQPIDITPSSTDKDFEKPKMLIKGGEDGVQLNLFEEAL